MLPHGRSDSGTGVPTCLRQITRPVAWSSPYIESFSVAAMTSWPTSSGWP
jgi:hypothetical protein